jgi:hypothetical protein
MKMRLATAITIICVCLAWSGEGEAAVASASSSRCDWIKAEKSVSGTRVAQIDHCCVGSRRCPPPNENVTECAYACFGGGDNCTGKLIRGGYPHIAFDGYTPEDCTTFILSTPWCGACP